MATTDPEGERKRGGKQKATLKYPQHAFDPQDLLQFVELDEFIDDWKALGLDDDDDLWMLQIAIMADPAGAPVIEGTGGLRKLRFAPMDWNRGKRGAARVCYAYFEEHGIVLLCAAYDHHEKDNLSAQEKRGIKEYIDQIKKWLSERAYK
jgi:hypothetical protein